MKKRKLITKILKYLILLGLGILIGWWSNELYRFADAMRNDRAPNLDSLNLVFNIDSLRQEEKLNNR